MFRLLISEPAPGVVRATIDNPPINMFDPDLYAELRLLVERMEHDASLKVVIVDSAHPDYFVSHLDVHRLAEVPDRAGAAALVDTWHDFITRWSAAPVVTVAAIRGRARGIGDEFALAFDLRFASRERALFAQPEVGFGVVPGGGALDWLPRIVGRSRALQIALSGEDIDATTAELWGLVNQAVPDDKFEAFVAGWARRVASFDRAALRTIKTLIDDRSITASAGELLQSFRAISDAITHPEAQRRMSLMERDGWGRDTTTERDHPDLLEGLAIRGGAA